MVLWVQNDCKCVDSDQVADWKLSLLPLSSISVRCAGRRPQPALPGQSRGVVSGLDGGMRLSVQALLQVLRAREAGRAAQQGSLLMLVLKSLCLYL